MGALLVAFTWVVSGCQLITGSYEVSSTGPNCSALASCCGDLGASEGDSCTGIVSDGDEAACSAFQTALPSNACSSGGSTKKDGGGVVIVFFPDAAAHHDGAIVFPTPDASTPHDAKSSPDTGNHQDVTTTQPDTGGGGDQDAGDDTGVDAGTDTGGGSPPDLTGTWTLGGATCNGTQLGLDEGSTTTLTFTTGSAEEIETLSDGCEITEDIAPDSISDTDITSTAGSVACGSGCTTADGCTAGSTGAIDLPYTLADGTLTISEAVDTSECSSGTIEFNFQMD